MFDSVPAEWVAEFGSSPHYVSGADGSQVLLLVGPFSTAAEAQSWVDPAQDALLHRGDLEVALAVGVSRVLGSAPVVRPGDLNAQLGVRTTR
jgi:hypothetical protein